MKKILNELLSCLHRLVFIVVNDYIRCPSEILVHSLFNPISGYVSNKLILASDMSFSTFHFKHSMYYHNY